VAAGAIGTTTRTEYEAHEGGGHEAASPDARAATDET
jgi:hypothetical protein